MQRSSENPKEKGSRPSSFPRRKSLGKGSPKGTSRSGKENQPTWYAFKKGECPKVNVCDKGNCQLGKKCAFKHTEKAWRRAKDAKHTILNKFRLSLAAQSLVQEREKKDRTLGIAQQSGHNDRSPIFLSCEQLGSCAEIIEANMEVAREKP